MTEIDATPNLDTTPAQLLGPVAYRLRIPAITLPGYVRMQLLLVRPAGARGGRRNRWSSWLFLLACCAIGIVLGVAASANQWTAELFIGTADADDGWLVGGRGVIVLAFVLMALTTLAGMIALQRAQHRIMRNVHEAGGDLFGAHDLFFGEGGLYLQNAARCAFVPWSRVTRIVEDKDSIFIVADHVSAFWITEDVLVALPDRAAFMSYVADRLAAHPREDRTQS